MDGRVLAAIVMGGILAMPLVATSQIPPQHAETAARVGLLAFNASETQERFTSAMKAHGWIVGQNLTIERRSGESAHQLQSSAAELTRLKLNVLGVTTAGLARIAQLEAKTTPIVVLGAGDDLVGMGLAASLAKPGGNITGVQILQEDLAGKRFQLLKELVGAASRIAYLDESVTRSEDQRARRRQQELEAARSLGLQIHFYTAARPEYFPALFEEMVKSRDQVLVVEAAPLVSRHRKQIIDLAAKHRIPANYNAAAYVQGGGLMSYGANRDSSIRRAASLVDKILRGAKVGDPTDRADERV